MSTVDSYNIEILTKDSLKDYLFGRKNPKLASETLKFIENHFNIKIGDFVKVTFEFGDYHGKECYLSVEHFVPIKTQVHKRIHWNAE
jgi:hypothetical protein